MDLNKHDLFSCVRRLPAPVLKLLKDEGRQTFCAGGYVRACVTGEPANDIDLFTFSHDNAALVAGKLASEFGIKADKTDNAWTVKPRKSGAVPVQIIHRWTFDKELGPFRCLASFDFTIACAAFWFHANNKEWQSAVRVLKFYQRGYCIPLDSLGAVVARLNRGINGPRNEHESDEGWQARIITGLLREVDPLTDPENIYHFPAPKLEQQA